MKAARGGCRRIASAAGVFVACLTALVPVGDANGLSDAEARGKQIYLEGTPPGVGDIAAELGSESVLLPASAAPCASCHGPDGRGRPEGGVLPPDIRWSELTKTYGHVHPNGRRHPAFDAASVAQLVRTGVDPAGNRVDSAMPRYTMSDAYMEDLLAYLRHLEMESDPGVEPQRLRVATLLPLQGPAGALGEAMAQVMRAYFQERNAAGGVFGRRIDLLVIPYGASPAETRDNLRAAFEREGIFALVGPYTVGQDEEIRAALREEGVPVVAPFTLDPDEGTTDANTFYVYPGFAEQVRVLAEEALAAGSAGAKPPILVGPEGARGDRLIAAARGQLRGRTFTEPLALRYPEGALDSAELVGRVRETAADALLFFGNQTELASLLEVLAEGGQHPRIYLLSTFVSRALFDSPPVFQRRLFLAFPTLASDLSANGRAEYGRLARNYSLPADHVQGQIAAYAAAKLFVQGLKGVGRNLSRSGLVDALESLYAYDTGLTPLLTYGPNRRIGARGAYVVAVDLLNKRYEPIGGWHALQ